MEHERIPRCDAPAERTAHAASSKFARAAVGQSAAGKPAPDKRK
ncbi:MAG: hypothetical protein M5R42_05010 [Rhodocyclaceae bacterium]|nr:hypothetical protein [Rhodocyclaceae bacterium]